MVRTELQSYFLALEKPSPESNLSVQIQPFIEHWMLFLCRCCQLWNTREKLLNITAKQPQLCETAEVLRGAEPTLVNCHFISEHHWNSDYMIMSCLDCQSVWTRYGNLHEDQVSKRFFAQLRHHLCFLPYTNNNTDTKKCIFYFLLEHWNSFCSSSIIT